MLAVNSYFVKIQGSPAKHTASQMLFTGACIKPLLWMQEGSQAVGQREVKELLWRLLSSSQLCLEAGEQALKRPSDFTQI